jgi:magnesium-transporting ATPase (P-type)
MGSTSASLSTAVFTLVIIFMVLGLFVWLGGEQIKADNILNPRMFYTWLTIMFLLVILFFIWTQGLEQFTSSLMTKSSNNGNNTPAASPSSFLPSAYTDSSYQYL